MYEYAFVICCHPRLRPRYFGDVKKSAYSKRTIRYCAGPHCNGADRAALNLARLGRKVKIMIGGMTGWADEGFAFATA
ncbi:hypothetical protein ASF91_13435 [Rhizobium sp. Leaf155]|nr:hypothetical protein ASF91_13435 [Rhizobium sp. Leaf155]